MEDTLYQIRYPVDTHTSVQSKHGKTRIDFSSGEVIDPDSQSDELSNNLKALERDAVKSLVVFVSDAETIISSPTIGIISDGMNLLYKLENISINTLYLEFPNGRIPLDDFEFYVMGFTEPSLPMNLEKMKLFHLGMVSGNSDATFQTKILICTIGYEKFNLTISNTGANDIEAQVLYQDQTGSGILPDVAYETIPTIASGKNNHFNTEIIHRYYTVQVRSKVAGSPSTFSINFNLVK